MPSGEEPIASRIVQPNVPGCPPKATNPDPCASFLRDLSDPECGQLEASRVAVVVAHPDDETIGLGAQLPRLDGITIVHVTDGAPRSGHDVADRGYASWRDYADARRQELVTAMALARVPADALVSFDIPDQEATDRIAEIARRLTVLFHERSIRHVLTHAFEGGHPDHDACAAAVHLACGILRARGLEPPCLIEMPYYTLGRNGWRVQRFDDARSSETVIELRSHEQRLKRAMLAAHSSQAAVLSLFPIQVERFRCSPSYDFTRLPNSGLLLYEDQNWGMTGARWLDAIRTALNILGQEEEPCP
ncbi:PIG-L deacetylase family protein [Microvirga subterranea]|nr:PIG-L family deacetylase [Microvirga subterranea]